MVRNWGNPFGNSNTPNTNAMNNMNNMNAMNAQAMPGQNFPTQYSQPQVSPTQQYVQTNVSNNVVPHYHPSHLTTINRQNINHQHHFPHTQSCINECCETHTMCGTPFNHTHMQNPRGRGW